MFQNYARIRIWTVFENMAFGLMLRKTPKDESKGAWRSRIDP